MDVVLMGHRLAIEESLYQGLIWVGMKNGRWWKAYRYGNTRFYGADGFTIPIRAGSTALMYTQITQQDKIPYVWDRYAFTARFLWCEENPLIHVGKSRP